MKMSINEAIISGIVFITILVTGCAGPDYQTIKMSRVVAAENMKLKEELRQRDWEVKSLKEVNEQQVEKLENIIKEHKQQIELWQEKSRQNIRQQVKDILDVVLERNAELREEIKALKEDNEKLKIELQEQKKKAGSLKEL